MTKNNLIGMLCGVAVCAGVGYCGPDWEEPTGDDAGDSTQTSQVPKGSGQLNTLMGKTDNGNLLANGPGAGGPDLQDLYLIRIVSPATFSATTVPIGGGSGDASFDTQLFLFRADGSGMLANDEAFSQSDGSLLTNDADDGTGITVTAAGLYYLGISGFDSSPLAGVPGSEIFSMVSRLEVSGPDGPGGSLGRLVGWTAGGATGTYLIDVDGCSFAWGCDGDANGDGTVDVDDLSYVIFRLGDTDEPGADVNQDAVVDVNDITFVLFRLGPCPS